VEEKIGKAEPPRRVIGSLSQQYFLDAITSWFCAILSQLQWSVYLYE